MLFWTLACADFSHLDSYPFISRNHFPRYAFNVLHYWPMHPCLFPHYQRLYSHQSFSRWVLMLVTAPFVLEKECNHAMAKLLMCLLAAFCLVLKLHQVYSIEADPANAAIAKRMVEIAGLSHVVTIIHGKVCDVIPKLKSEHHVTHVDFCFVDHLKDCYLSDVQLLEGSELLRPGSCVVADNILYPGICVHTLCFRFAVLDFVDIDSLILSVHRSS